MALVKNENSIKLKLAFNAGLDENNKVIVKNRTYSNIKPTVSDEDLYEFGAAISALQSYSLMNLVRYEQYEMINE